MLPRGALDIGWTDLAFGLVACIRGGDRRAAQAEAEAEAEAAWSTDGDALCALSVRSGFDAALSALQLPPGGEVLTSALTIDDMPRILAEHGLVAVPVDVEMDTLSVPVEALEQAVTPRTCAVLVAHLFGSRMPVEDHISLCRRHGLAFIEDCAQAYAGADYAGHPDSDVSMFSFGSIKTNTALGGAVLKVNDPALLDAMRMVQARQPVQSRSEYLHKVVKHAAIKAVARPVPYGVLASVCRLLGTDHDVVITRALRGFSGPDFFGRIRRQPSYPLLKLLERRLRTFDGSHLERRTRLARSVQQRLPAGVRVGARAESHSHWIFPVTSSAPDRLVRTLWSLGLDATRGRTSLAVVPPPTDRPDLAATTATEFLSRVVYLPVHARACDRQLARLCSAVTDVEAGRTDHPTTAPVTRQRTLP